MEHNLPSGFGRSTSANYKGAIRYSKATNDSGIVKPSSTSTTRRVTIRTFLAGFVLGGASCSILFLAHRTDLQMRHTTIMQDQVAHGILPIQNTPCLEDNTNNGIKSVGVRSSEELLDMDQRGNGNSLIDDFDSQARAVIATKIQGPQTVGQLNQSLCLLTAAYNHKVNYDIVVFTATPIQDYHLESLKSTVSPANLTVVIDNPGLQHMVDELPEDRKQELLQRCNAKTSSDLQWWTRCEETTSSHTSVMPIQYNWQAEFRSLHIWNHPAITKYKYMLWLDSDGMCSKKWDVDPIATMRRNDLVLLFDHFPAGRANGEEFVQRTKEAFGKAICEISMSNGTLIATSGFCKSARFLRQIYGFFHVTDLDFYRSEPVMNWQRIMIGDSKFSRRFDDQVAVTIPAAVLAGNRSWHMRYFGLNMGVVHNNRMDGSGDEKVGHFRSYWKRHGKTRFPEAYNQCALMSSG